MRILHIVNDAETGGAQTLIEALGEASKSSHGPASADQHYLLVLLGTGALSARLATVMADVQYANLRRRSVLPLAAIALVRKMVKTHGIDVVHSHLLQSDLVNILTPHGRPKISTVHTSGSHESRAVSQLVGRAVAALSSAFSAVVACSPSARDYAITMKYARAGDIQVVFNGSQIPESAPVPDVELLQESGPIILHLARWHPMKDHATLFRAMAQISRTYPTAKLECAGLNVDSDNAGLQELVDASGISSSVSLLGSVSDVGELFRRAAVLVISSSHGEAMPMAGIEALAAGVPVITTDVGDCRDLVVDPAFLVPPSQPAALASALQGVLSALAEDKPNYAAWSHAAWELAATKFDARKTAQAYQEIYSTLTA